MTLLYKSFILLANLFFVSLNLQAEVIDDPHGNHAKHPSMGVSAGQSEMKTAMMQPEGPTAQGKVMEVTSASGYTYLLLEAGEDKFWVAATQVSAKVGDVVSYIANVTMHDFTSKAINKTFDSIIFVSTVKVVQ